MALPRDLVEGQGLTWTGPSHEEPAVLPGERGIFVSYDGHGPDDGYVVDFPGGRNFCCRRSDVTPDPGSPVQVNRRHNST